MSVSKRKINEEKLKHEKYLKKMGIYPPTKKRKKTTYKTDTRYAENYYEDKVNGGIEYNNIKRPSYIDIDNEKPETIMKLHKKQMSGAVMIDACTGPRDLDYPTKEIPEQLKL